MNAKTEPGLLEQMRQVLCDPTGAVVIDGSDDDRATVAAGLEAAAELVAADLEFDAAKDALAEAKREKGNWRVNPLGHNHPAVLRTRAAADRRRAALAKFGGAA